MISTIGQSNNVQRFSAATSVRPSISTNTKSGSRIEIPQREETTSIPKGLMAKVDVDELRECAKAVGEYDISDEEIKYGLMYGRSVIAEFLC